MIIKGQLAGGRILRLPIDYQGSHIDYHTWSDWLLIDYLLVILTTKVVNLTTRVVIKIHCEHSVLKTQQIA